jgi:chromosome segregation ATPase
MEKTESVYRFKQMLKAGESGKFTVQTKHIDSQSIAILTTEIEQLLVYTRFGQIPQNVKDILAKAITLKQALVDTDLAIKDKEARIAATGDEQNRLRENMKVVDRQAEYYKRLLTKLNDQETEIEKIRTDLDALRETQKSRRADIENYLNSISTD